MKTDKLCVGLAALAICGVSSAWDPNNGDWSKSDPNDFRVMTWNVQDALCRTNAKQDDYSDWNAIVRAVTAMKPDVLILQECGDNDGNGTGSGVDSVSQLETVMDLFINGGSDPYLGGSVGSYIKLFDPALDYPYVFVSTVSDSFNRNVIISRHPFADINNDLGGLATFSNIVLTSADAYAPGGNGGIRGYMFAEIDLPDAIYAGDIVVGNGHLKSGGTSGDGADREDAAQNIAYHIDYFYNGAGTGSPDPNSKIPFDIPGTTTILDANTPVVWGGDFNQRIGPASGNSKSPAEWMTQAVVTPGTDGTDRDRTNSTWDSASHPLTGDTTTQSSSKIDFWCWQDSIATPRRQFIFRTDSGWPTGTPFPAPVDTFPPVPQALSNRASDHRPVLIDFILPLAPPPACVGDLNGDLVIDTADLGILLAQFGGPGSADLNNDGVVDTADLGILLGVFGTNCP
ncbi:MAG: hypothetical protein H6814_11330 [Phycisphaeraceae bacterium]|nr:hypothetical protein [Phycisphaeraceae bacterium]